MKKLNSKQKAVKFIYCANPITIDKRSSWGQDATNLQIAENGAFLKMKNNFEVSHLVQPNSKNDAPVGWIKTETESLFDKLPIYVSEEVVPANKVTKVETLDGIIEYCLNEDAVLCYNSDENGDVNLSDVWLQKISDLKENYDY